ncbi:MAG: bacteriohemerythrin [Geopsychrobacter sp.]|nr:bacteriohemerythrin [Geopsychrobacter sp.]
MAIISWKDCYATGIEQCDEEHRDLVIRINSLYEAIRNKDAVEKLPRIIDDLVKYTLAHFVHEEELMAQHEYPELNEHQQKHADLKTRVEEFKAQLETGDEQLPLKLFNFLRAWLLEHIVEVDQRYASFLKGKGVS